MTRKKMWKPKKPPFRVHKKKVFENVIKTCDFIYQIGESEDLRKSSKEVSIAEITSKEFKKKIAYLKKCFLEYKKRTGWGKGIAGVQVGIPERFCLIFTTKPLIFINPKIIKRSEKLYIHREICMSANPIVANVIRPAWVEVECFDEFGKKQYWNTKDTTKEGRSYNRVLQHEIDHLDGIICIDRVDSRDIIFESDPKILSRSAYEEVSLKKI